MGCDWAGSMHTDTNGQKSEPKVFFANERTMISWLGMAVTLSSISTGMQLSIDLSIDLPIHRPIYLSIYRHMYLPIY